MDDVPRHKLKNVYSNIMCYQLVLSYKEKAGNYLSKCRTKTGFGYHSVINTGVCVYDVITPQVQMHLNDMTKMFQTYCDIYAWSIIPEKFIYLL